MTPSARAFLAALAFIDLAVGATVLLFPGLWQELLHPLAMGTVFYPIQRLGAAWLARAALTAATAARPAPGRLFALAALWAIEVPADLLLAWRTAHTGPDTLAFYGLHAAVAAVLGAWLWRSAGRCP